MDWEWYESCFIIFFLNSEKDFDTFWKYRCKLLSLFLIFSNIRTIDLHGVSLMVRVSALLQRSARVTRARMETKGPAEDVSRTKITDWTEVEAERCSRRNRDTPLWRRHRCRELADFSFTLIVHAYETKRKKREHPGVENTETQIKKKLARKWRFRSDEKWLGSRTSSRVAVREKQERAAYKVALIQKFL